MMGTKSNLSTFILPFFPQSCTSMLRFDDDGDDDSNNDVDEGDNIVFLIDNANNFDSER